MNRHSSRTAIAQDPGSETASPRARVGAVESVIERSAGWRADRDGNAVRDLPIGSVDKRLRSELAVNPEIAAQHPFFHLADDAVGGVAEIVRGMDVIDIARIDAVRVSVRVGPVIDAHELRTPFGVGAPGVSLGRFIEHRGKLVNPM